MELYRYMPLDSTWLKAAVIGSLWASVEIVAGSFLHNLQIPLSGTILTGFAIFLLSAFSKLWPERGIIWRAGIICALMKSISPSSIIIGPMVGIITESVLFEMFLVLAGRNFAGALLGGAFAAVSAIVHKFLTLLILYGFDLVRILDSLYHYAVKQLNIQSLQPTTLIVLLAALYMLVGMAAATIGLFAGNNYLKMETPPTVTSSIQVRNENQLFGFTEKQNFSSLLIVVHLVILTAILWLINLNSYLPAITAAFMYLVFCMLRYPAALRRLRKTAIWFQFVLIVLTSVFIWDYLKMEVPGGESGWIIGMKMVFRAILLILGFASISVELKNPLVKTVLYKKGLSNLYQAVNLAFGVLPDLIASFSSSKLAFLRPGTLSVHLLGTAQNLIEIFKNEQNSLPVVFVLTGEVGTGKTAFAEKLVESLQIKGFVIGGFISEGIMEESIRTGFRLRDIRSAASVVLCQTTYQEDWGQTGRYYFNPEVFDFGNSILDPLHLEACDLVLIDEIGHLEVHNQGWSSAIERLSARLSTPQVWIVRKSLVHKIIRKWNVGDLYLFDIEIDDFEEVEKMLLTTLKRIES